MLGDIARAKDRHHEYYHAGSSIANARAFEGRLLAASRPRRSAENAGDRWPDANRACGELMAIKNVVVINDEAHHCYRRKVGDDDEESGGDEA